MERQEFQKRLEELGRLAQEKENRLRTEEVREFLKDMELTEEQLNMVFAYLASRLVKVEGYVPAGQIQEEEEIKLTPEEESFLEQYRKELGYLTLLGEEELQKLCDEAENTGDAGAKARLTEQLLPEVIREARSFAGRGLPFADLVQEGNIGLMLAMETLGLRSEEQSALDYLKQEIRTAIAQALEEQQTEQQAGDLIAERLNHLSDGIKKLSDELERKVSLEELSIFMDMPVEEIEDLLKLAGEGTAEEDKEGIADGSEGMEEG